MSTTIDQKVVEMRFDNKNFENNVKTTMSSLEKLKERLKLTGASKGLEDVTKAANKVDFSKMEYAATKAGFQVQDIWLKTASVLEYQVARRIVNAGKNMLNALTVAPIKDGWHEYELMLNSVQTTMAGTGLTAEQVEKELKKLDEYADKTVYSTADMMNNLPKFTNAGVELDKATKAMIGIANATAHAGGDAGKASIAFYNLGQAIGTGYLTRMDYNSINNAGIATMAWKEAMVEAAIAQGTLTKVGENSYKAGNKTLTLQQLFIDGLQEQWATTDVMMKVFGDYGDATTEIGKKAYESAQKIKTFTMMMDSLKATSGTGWKDTWQIIFGSLDDATEFWTGINNALSGLITGFAKWRNDLLEDVMGSPLTSTTIKFIKKVNKGTKELKDSLDTIVKTVDGLGEIVDDVILGKFGNGKERFDKLTEAGYNWAEVQNKVNEKLGSSVRHQVKMDKTGKSLNKTTESGNKTRGQTIAQLVEMTDAELKDLGLKQREINALRILEEQSRKTGIPINELAEDLSLLEGRTLLINSFKNIGDGLVTTFKALAAAWKDIFKPIQASQIYDLIAGFHKLTTHLKFNDDTVEQLQRTFKGLFAALDIVLTLTSGPLKIAFEIFKGILEALDVGILEFTAAVGDSVVRFRDWIDSVINFEEIIGVMTPYIKKAAGAIREWMNDHVHLAEWVEKTTDLIANAKTVLGQWIDSGLGVISPYITKIANAIGLWVDENVDLSKWLSTVCGWLVSVKDTLFEWGSAIYGVFSPYVTAIIDSIKKWVDENIHLTEWIAEIEKRLVNAKTAISDWIEGLKNAENVGEYLRDTIGKIFSSIVTYVRDKVKEIGTAMLECIGEFSLMDWSSVPSDIIEGFNKGFTWGILSVVKNVKVFCTKVITAVKDMFGIHSPSRVMSNIAMHVVEGFNQGFTNGITGIFTKVKTFCNTVINTAKSLFGIHSPSTVMAEIGKNVIEGFINGITSIAQNAIDAVAKLFTKIKEISLDPKNSDFFSGVIESAKKLGGKLAEVFSQIDFGKIAAAALGAGMLLVVKKTLDVFEMFGKPLEGLGDLLEGIGEAFSGFGKNLKASAMMKRAKAVLIISLAIVILIAALEPILKMDWDQLGKAAVVLLGIAGILIGVTAALAGIAKIGGEFGSIKLLPLAGALIMLAFTMKLISQIAADGNVEGTIKIFWNMILGLLSIMVAFGLLVKADKAGNMDKAGVMMYKMSGALLIMASVFKIVGTFTFDTIIKGLAFVTGVGLIFAAVIALSHFAGQYANEAGAMLLKMSIAMLVMTLIVKMVSKFSESDIQKGLSFMSGVEILFAGIIVLSKMSGQYADLAAKLIFKMGLALLMTVAAVKLVAGMSEQDITKGIAVVAAIEVLFAGIIYISKYAGQHAAKAGAMLLMMSIALGAVLLISFLAGKMNPADIWKGVAVVGALSTMFAGLIAVTKFSKGSDKLNKTLIILMITIGLMVAAVIALSFIDPKNLATATGALMGVIGMFAVIMLVTKYTKNTKHVHKSLITMVVIVGLLAGIIALMSKLDPKSALGVSGALSALLLSFTASIFILGKSGKVSSTVQKILRPLLLVTVGLGALLAAMSFIPNQNIPSLIASSIALGILLNAFTASIVVLNNARSINKTVQGVLLDMVLVAGALAILLTIMSFIPSQNIPSLTASATALGVLLNAFAASILILDQVKGISNSIIPALVAMTLVTAGLGLILGMMANNIASQNIPSLIASTIALSVLLNALSFSIGILSAVGRVSTSAMVALAPMTLVAAGLGAIIAIMSNNIAGANIASLIASSIALGILLNALAVSVDILSLAGPKATAAIPAALGMSLVLAAVALIVGVLITSIGSSAGSALPLALALSTLLVTMTIVMTILAAVGTFAASAIPGALALASVIGIVGGILIALGALNQIPGLREIMADGGALLQTIGAAIGQFIGGLIGGIAQGAAAALPAIAISLSQFAMGLQPFIMAMRMVDEQVLFGAGFLAGAIGVLTASAFISGMTSLLNISLTELGSDLTGFGTSIIPFLSTLKMIKPEEVEAAKTLAEMILILTAAEMMSGITSFIGGNADFSKFGTQLVAFGNAICEFSNILKNNGGIDEEAVQSAARAGETMAGLQKALYGSGGLKQDIFGEKDLTAFGQQLRSFGRAIVDFSNVLVNNGGIDEKAVTSAAKAGETMAGLQNALYGAGGLKQDIFGEKDLTLFGNQLRSFGYAIVAFNNAIVNNGGIDEESVTSAANAGKAIAGLQNELYGAGGLKQDIFGEKDLSVFGTQLKAFGQALVDFSGIVTGKINDEAVTSAASAGTMMTAIANAIPTDTWFDGRVSMSDFGAEIVTFGKKMVEFSNALSGYSSASVGSATSAAERLVTLTKNLVGLDVTGITTFRSVTIIAETIKTFATNLAEVNLSSISTAISSARNILTLINDMVGIDTSGVAAFKNAVANLATVNLNALADAFQDTSKFTSVGSSIIRAIATGIVTSQFSLYPIGLSVSNTLATSITSGVPAITATITKMMLNITVMLGSKKNDFSKIGKDYMTKFADGIRSQSGKVTSALRTLINSALTVMKGYKSSFYDVGKDAVRGFANGITENTFMAEARAKAMAEAAIRAARRALDEHSPSRVFYGIGAFAGQGFVNALGDYVGKAYTAGSEMATTAKNGLSDAIGKAKDMIGTDLNAQPTIRPVLDLSDVQSGAARIGDLFNGRASVGVLANVGAVSSMMDSRNQNGAGGEVVSAINKLRKDLKNVGNTVYNIDGITYDDSSNISGAMKELVRAIKVEGRV